eukprot:CAMPEP_0194046598 /NCGR_PEP_ID=MMETSP0009_2-20130614/21835_1 /TAXON_ID=210454 /ORGANISM="Grammatophora oceanica, Strain CCMP 410" /LENGTH=254 /DNA_ID=CAMNT_0038691963 /DNA_START=220 /DNA_END=984 /DNA_ORIENTATION=-
MPLSGTNPTTINLDIATGMQDSTALVLRYGLGDIRLKKISTDDKTPLVTKWQQMMETFLSTQVHVLAGLGYKADETGLQAYNVNLVHYMQEAEPSVQEELRIKGRDNWRIVLSTAFSLDMSDAEELSIVEARNIMHSVSQKMQDERVLAQVKERVKTLDPNESDQRLITAQKHHAVQEVMIDHVYLGDRSPTLVEELGFEPTDLGYVKLQWLMSEHQGDALIAQYIQGGMMKMLEAAELNLSDLQSNSDEAINQ